MNLDLVNLEENISFRKGKLNSGDKLLMYIKGKKLDDYPALDRHLFNLISMDKFQTNNVTFNERINSGNVGIILHDSFKNQHKQIKDFKIR